MKLLKKLMVVFVALFMVMSLTNTVMADEEPEAEDTTITITVHRDSTYKDTASGNTSAAEGDREYTYYKVFDAAKAILEVENFKYAVSQLAQTTMRNAVGSVSLDELLSSREKIATQICKIIDEATDPWGIKVENVELKEITLPEEMKRVIAKVAEAEREKAAVITKAEGEVEAANNLAKAATVMGSTPGALHLRTLATLNDLSSDQSNTIIFAIPIEVLKAFEGVDAKKVIETVKESKKK